MLRCVLTPPYADRDIAFKNNDQLKTNTALQMESAKIEFKVM